MDEVLTHWLVVPQSHHPARNMALGINYGRLCPACLENRDTDGVATLVPIEIGYDTQHKAC